MSTPNLTDFNPHDVPWQYDAIKYVRRFDYSKGILELLLSGSVGSAKSICAAHIIATHCLINNGSRFLLVRRALKDLKRTLWRTLIAHLEGNNLIKDYNKSEMRITLINGSEIIGDSYDDMNLEKFRSLELSGCAVEEATESSKEVYDAIKMRIGRLPSIKENLFILLTNPSNPSHYIYKEFMESESPNKKIFYSLTEQNKYLPPWYVENLKRDLDPKMARRMLYGEWIEISQDVVYHSYDSSKQYLKNTNYIVNPRLPTRLSFDFNIGLNKPMSACVSQYDAIKDEFHIFGEAVVHGSRTNDLLEELNSKGLLTGTCELIVHGDASGKHKDTRSIHSDYDIIKKFLSNLKDCRFNENTGLQVPLANPPIRTRHNRVNAYCKNDIGQTRLYVYKGCKTVDEALRLTQLKKGADLIEDDSKQFQHIGTALGYMICYVSNSVNLTRGYSERIR